MLKLSFESCELHLYDEASPPVLEKITPIFKERVEDKSRLQSGN